MQLWPLIDNWKKGYQIDSIRNPLLQKHSRILGKSVHEILFDFVNVYLLDDASQLGVQCHIFPLRINVIDEFEHCGAINVLNIHFDIDNERTFSLWQIRANGIRNLDGIQREQMTVQQAQSPNSKNCNRYLSRFRKRFLIS